MKVAISRAGLAACFAVVAVAGCPASRSSTRAVISGRVKLEPEPGLNDMSRVKVNLGRGEGDVTPDEDGAFQVSDVEPDVYEVTVTYAGGLSPTASRSAYQALKVKAVATAGGSVNLGDVVPELATGTVVGSVQLPPGSTGSADGAEVVVKSTGGRTVTGTVSGGSFSISGVRVGHHQVTVTKSGYATGTGQDLCTPALTVDEEGATANAPALSLSPASASFLPGGAGTVVARGSTWFFRGPEVTVRAATGYARQRRAWSAGSAAPDYEDVPGQDNAWVLPAPAGDGGAVDGAQEWNFQFADRCGYESPIYTLTLVRDEAPPVLSQVLLNGGAAFATSTTLRLTLVAQDALSSSLEMAWTLCRVEGSTETCSPTLAQAPWTPLAPLVAVPAAGDGAWRVHAHVRDVVGNVGDEQHADVVVDSTQPDLPVVLIGDGSRFHEVDVTVHVLTSLDAREMRVSTEDVGAATWKPFEAAFSYRFTPGEGDKSLSVQVRDAAGNQSQVGTGTARLVTSARVTGRVLLPTGQPAAGATVRTADGTGLYTTGSAGTWELVLQQGSQSVQALPPPGMPELGGNADSFVVVADVEQARPDLVLKELKGGLSGRVLLQGGTDHSGITVLIKAEPAARPGDVAVTSEDGSWKSNLLVIGSYRVIAQKERFERKDLGVFTVGSETTVPVPEATLARLGGFAINGGAGFTNNPLVSLSVDATGASECLVTDDDTDTTFAHALRLGCGSGTIPFTLNGADGLKTVRVRVLATPPRDLSSSIILDTLPPDLAASRITLDDGARFTTRDSVSLRVTAADATSGVSAMLLSTDGTQYSEAGFQDVSVQALPNPGQDGLRTFRVKLKDRAGNVTATALTASIYRDATKPNPGLVTVNGSTAALVREPTITLHLAATEACDADYPGGCPGVTTRDPFQVMTSLRSDFQGSTWAPYANQVVQFLSPVDVDQRVYVAVRDEAGNEDTAAPVTVTLDRQAPRAPVLTLANGSAFAPGPIVALGVSTTDSSTEGYVLVLEGDLASAPLELDYAGRPATVTLSAGEGPKVVRAHLRDAAGWDSGIAAATVVVDSQPPTVVDFRVAGGSPYVTVNPGDTYAEVACSDAQAATVDLTVTVKDGSGALLYQGALLPALPIRLPAPEGRKKLSAWCTDGAGHAADPVTADVTLDATPPVITALVLQGGTANGPPVPVSSPAVTVVLTVTDAVSGPAASALSETAITSCAGLSFLYGVGTLGFTFSGPDGNHELWACARDAAGNETVLPVQSTNSISLDRHAPDAPLLVLGSGSGWTATPHAVALAITPAETASGFRMRLSGDLAAARPEEAFQSSAPVELSATEGRKTVSVVLVDAAGNASTPATASITLDQTPPSLSNALTIGNGSGYVRSAAGGTTVSATCTDNLATGADLHLVVTEGAATLLDAPYQSPLPLQLGGTPETTRNLAVRCVDKAGNGSTTVAAQVVLDHTSPMLTTFTVAGTGGSGYIRDPNVTVTLAASDGSGTGVQDLALSESAFDCTSAQYGPFPSGPVGFTFSSGQDTKRLYACIRDKAGNTNAATSVASSTVLVLDTTPPLVPTVVVAPQLGLPAGKPWTKTATAVPLAISTSESTTGLTVTISGDVTGRQMAFPTGNTTVDLSTDDGLKTVRVSVTDPAGNVSSEALDTITLDTGKPSVESVRIGTGSYVTTADGSAAVSARCTDALAASPSLTLGIGETLGATTTPLAAVPYKDPVNVVFGSTEGTRNFKLTCTDPAGNVSDEYAVSAAFDHTAPTVGSFTVFSLTGALPTRNTTVGYTLAATGATEASISDSTFACSGAVYAPLVSPGRFTLSGGDATYRLYACVRDAAGNANGVNAVQTSNTILVDTTPPPAGLLELAHGAPSTTSGDVHAALFTAASAATRVHLDGDLERGATDLLVSDFPTTLRLSSGDGNKSVTAQLVDDAGNASDVFSAQVSLDTGVPLRPTVVFSPSTGFTGSTTVTVELRRTESAAPGDLMRLACDGNLGNAPLVAYALTSTCVLPAGLDGSRTVVAQIQDAAGNVSPVDSNSITLDATAPTLPVLAATPALTAVSPVMLSIASSSTDANFESHEVAGAQYATWTDVGTTFFVSLATEGQPYTLRVRGRDKAGNRGAEATVTLTRDSTNPTKPCLFTGCPATQTVFTNTSSYTVTLLVPATDANLAGYQTCVSLSGACDCTMQDTPGTTSFTVALYQNLSNRFCIQAKDGAGNRSTAEDLIIIHDNTPPTAPVLADVPPEVTTAKMDLFLRTASTDTNFSHYEVLGGTFLDATVFCAATSSPYCAALSPNPLSKDNFLLDASGVAVSVRVGLQRDDVNHFEIRGVDKAGNKSAVAMTDVLEASSFSLGITTDTVGEVQVAGDVVAYAAKATSNDKLRLRGAGPDFRWNTSDDVDTTPSIKLLQGSWPTTGRAISVQQDAVAWVDTANDANGGPAGAAVNGSIWVTESGVDGALGTGDDRTVRVTPFTAGVCGTQKGFREPSLGAPGNMLVNCWYSATDWDIYLVSAGNNGVFDGPNSDDLYTPVSNGGQKEGHGTLARNFAAFLMWDPPNSQWDLYYRTVTANGTAAPTMGTFSKVVDGVQETAPAVVSLYADGSVPTCQQGILYAFTGGVSLYGPGPDAQLGTGDDTTTRILVDASLVDTVFRLSMAPGVLYVEHNVTDGDVVITAGANGCFDNPVMTVCSGSYPYTCPNGACAANANQCGDDVVTKLRTGSHRGAAVTRQAWVEAQDSIGGVEMAYHDLYTRKPVYWRVPDEQVYSAGRGADFSVLSFVSGSPALVDEATGTVRRSTQSTLYQRHFVGGTRKFASLKEPYGTDTAVRVVVTETGVDNLFFSSDDVALTVAQTAAGTVQPADGFVGEGRNIAMSDKVVAWFDTVGGGKDIKAYYAGANGKFEGAGVDPSECLITITNDNAARENLSVSGLKIVWQTAFTTFGVAELPAANPCTYSSATNQGFIGTGGLSRPRVAGTRVAGLMTGPRVVYWDAGSTGSFLLGSTYQASCRIPSGWTVTTANNGTTGVLDELVGDAYMVSLSRGSERRMFACYLPDSTLRPLDGNLPGTNSVAGGGGALLLRNAAVGGLMQVSR